MAIQYNIFGMSNHWKLKSNIGRGHMYKLHMLMLIFALVAPGIRRGRRPDRSSRPSCTARSSCRVTPRRQIHADEKLLSDICRAVRVGKDHLDDVASTAEGRRAYRHRC